MIQRILFTWGLIVFLFLCSREIQAQATIGARNAALGNATSALYDNNWGLFSNPATIHAKELQVGFYGLRNYGIHELTDISSLVTVPVSFGTTSLGLFRFGDDLYSETNLNVGFKASWDFIHAGIAVQYRHISFGQDYGSGGALSLNLGLLNQISDKIWLGAKVRNLTRASFDFEDSNEALPQDISIGVGYQLEDEALFLFDVYKDVRFPVNYRMGIEISVIENVIGRVGATYDPVIYTFGLGYEVENWLINLVVQQHQILGASPGAEILLKL